MVRKKIVIYLRKSRSDSEYESIEEVLSRHERQLQDYAVRTYESRIDELEQIKYQLESIIELMEEKGVEEISLKCNTYGLYGNFVSIPGKGFLPLEDTIDDLNEEEDYED